ncbi:MAG: PHP domain-containing protein [Syntrophomonas sp.]|nr:PHP domain-containing protein [Syntrophomonas sp.]
MDYYHADEPIHLGESICMYDLHVHTTASDGVLTPVEIISLAAEQGLTGLSITDHDTLAGLEPAQDFIRTQGIKLELIPGIEINTDFGQDEAHILGYFISDRDKHLADRLADIRSERIARAEKIVARLNQLGISIDMDQVRSFASGQLIGRPHIARALVALGHARTEADAFHRYIERDRPAYVPRYKISPAEAIHLIKKAGGLSVLAHPGLIKSTSKIDAIIAMGVEGLEVYYPEHTPAQIGELSALAQRSNLLITGGSDFHGAGPESRTKLGSMGIDSSTMGIIRNYHQNCQ